MPQLLQYLLAFGGILIFAWIANYLCEYQAEKGKKQQDESIRELTELTLAGLEKKKQSISKLID